MSVDKSKLIESVKIRPFLYDHGMYKGRSQTTEAWEEVRKECSLETVKEAKNAWTQLRNSFRTYLKTKNEKDCRYFVKLQFLKDHIEIETNNDSDDNESTSDQKSNAVVTTSLENNPTVNDSSYVASSCSYEPLEVDRLKGFFDSLYLMTKENLSASGQESVKEKCSKVFIDVKNEEMTAKK